MLILFDPKEIHKNLTSWIDLNISNIYQLLKVPPICVCGIRIFKSFITIHNSRICDGIVLLKFTCRGSYRFGSFTALKRSIFFKDKLRQIFVERVEDFVFNLGNVGNVERFVDAEKFADHTEFGGFVEDLTVFFRCALWYWYGNDSKSLIKFILNQ